MVQITSEITIKAPLPVVWDVITNLKYYRDWNSQFSMISGRVQPGSRIKLKFSPLYYKGYTVQPRIHRHEAPHVFGWHGLTLLPGIIDGEYLFKLSDLDKNTTRLYFYQRYNGFLSFLLPQFQIFKDARKSCIKMNAEIKSRVEEVFVKGHQAVLSA
ncbi:MAG: SRPBCC domain-containing protein [Owenweeksia sp.]|nr:SRPBCC domain-containing protein [Owenweeksia sp.]